MTAFNREKVDTVIYDLVQAVRSGTADDMPYDAVLDALEACVELDLHDPATENAVAEAITRFRGHWVPLHERYPWRRSMATNG